MTNRQKVIKGLECCNDMNVKNCHICPYLKINEDDGMIGCTGALISDAAALLKEREPARPYPGPLRYWTCGNFCGAELLGHEKYCPKCGRPVKWDE